MERKNRGKEDLFVGDRTIFQNAIKKRRGEAYRKNSKGRNRAMFSKFLKASETYVRRVYFTTKLLLVPEGFRESSWMRPWKNIFIGQRFLNTPWNFAPSPIY